MQAGPRGGADMGMSNGEADADATGKEELESHEDRINDISEGDSNARRNLTVRRQLRHRSIVVANPYEHMWEMFENHPQYHVRESPSRARALTLFAMSGHGHPRAYVWLGAQMTGIDYNCVRTGTLAFYRETLRTTQVCVSLNSATRFRYGSCGRGPLCADKADAYRTSRL